MALVVVPVRTNSDLNRFIKMVWPIYKSDPNWVPPLIADRKKLLNRQKNPFYKNAEMELFTAERDGEVIGRIAAIVNRRHNEFHQDKVGFFGFFECVDDEEVAAMLFTAAENWLKERGMEIMRGPVNPSFNDESGLLVEGFDDPPQILMTYNPKYYSRLIESFGLTKIKDLYAYRLTAEKFISDKLERVQQRVRERDGVTIRTAQLSPKSAYMADVALIKSIYNEAWERNWGFVPMTDDEFNFVAGDLKQIAEKDFIIFAEVNGEPVGFALGLPDINQAFKHNKSGRLIGALMALMFRKKEIKRGRIVILGVKPQYRRRGIDAVLYYEAGTRMTRGHGYIEGEASWILEDNLMMNRAAQLMNGEKYKTYRVYDKSMNKN